MNNNNPKDNEFFRLRQVFSQIEKNPKNSDSVKLMLLIKSATEMYKYLKSNNAVVDKIKAKKHIYGKADPQLIEMTEVELIAECDRCLNIMFDFDTAKFNYLQLRDVYKEKLNLFLIYEPFFDHAMPLLAKVSDKLKNSTKSESLEKDIALLNKEFDILKKENAKLKSDVMFWEQKEDIWTDQLSEELVNISSNIDKWKFLALLPGYSDVPPELMPIVTKIAAYFLINNKEKIDIQEVIKHAGVQMQEISVILQVPGFTVTDGKFLKFDTKVIEEKIHLSEFLKNSKSLKDKLTDVTSKIKSYFIKKDTITNATKNKN